MTAHNARDEGDETVTVSKWDFETLLAVATLYVESFEPDERMTLPERMNLQSVEEVLDRHGKRY